MKSSPFLINQDASGDSLQFIEASDHAHDEAWLQELLRTHPGILPTSEIEPVYYPLIPIGREVNTDSGPIDNLFISHRGYLVLVETKLWRNPEAKREVLAQTIDYGSSLSKWSFNQLDNEVREYTQKYELKSMNLFEWVEQSLGPVEDDRIFFEETVAKNLRLGRFLTMIVGDRIRQSLIDMLSYVNKYPHLAMDVALVEMRCYRLKPNMDWPLLVIPSVVAQTEIVERSIVQVNVQLNGAYQVDVKQEKEKGKDTDRKRFMLTEEAYWELLKERAPESYELVSQLVKHFRQMDGISIDTSEASIVARMNIQDSGQQATLFFVDKNAALSVWPDTISGQLTKAGLDKDLVTNYDQRVRDLLHSRNRKLPTHPIAEVNLNEFITAVQEFMDQISLAEPNPK